MPPPSSRRHGGQPGNTNALKHGFYTRRFKKRDLTGVEATNNKDLVEEIALIRVFTRCLLESIEPDLDSFELAAILRSLCLASSHSSVHDDINQAIREVNAILRSRKTSPESSADCPPPPVDSSVRSLALDRLANSPTSSEPSAPTSTPDG